MFLISKPSTIVRQTLWAAHINQFDLDIHCLPNGLRLIRPLTHLWLRCIPQFLLILLLVHGRHTNKMQSQ